MNNLGKIILFLSLMSITALASVTAKVQPTDIYAGDSATYILTIRGNDIVKPTITKICGNIVTARSSQTSIEAMKKAYKTSYTLSYEFTPRKNCTIAPIKVKVGSKIERSNSVKLVLKERKQKVNPDFSLSLSTSKKELYVGEPFTLTLIIKQKKDAKAVDNKFIKPLFKGFWIKSERKAQRTEKGNFIITKVLYKLAAQREGTLVIDPASLKIAKRTGSNNWGTYIPQIKWRTYFSNTISFSVKSLPNNAKIIGDFTLNAKVDRVVVNPNEPIKLTVIVTGEGNLEDIGSFKPYIPNVNVFDEKIVIKNNRLTQKLLFVGENNFTIPAFKLAYFDTKTKSVRQITTNPIAIKVNGGMAKSKVKIQRKESLPIQEEKTVSKDIPIQMNYLYISVAFIAGIVVGIIIMLAFKAQRSESKKTKLDFKNEKLLLIKLLPFKDDDAQVAEIVAKLERNIYGQIKESLDKKLLKEVIQKYNIS